MRIDVVVCQEVNVGGCCPILPHIMDFEVIADSFIEAAERVENSDEFKAKERVYITAMSARGSDRCVCLDDLSIK